MSQDTDPSIQLRADPAPSLYTLEAAARSLLRGVLHVQAARSTRGLVELLIMRIAQLEQAVLTTQPWLHDLTPPIIATERELWERQMERLAPATRRLGLPEEADRRMPSGRRLIYARTQALGDRGQVHTQRVFYTRDGLRVIVSIDNTPRHGDLLHVSISYQHKDPAWNEIKDVRGTFFPLDVPVMMVLPEQAVYVNVSAHCFHLIQMPREWMLD